MRIVITGALGHIGSLLLRELPTQFKNLSIVLIDNLATQRYCSLFFLPKSGRYTFVEADILTADLHHLFKGADAVVHLAAMAEPEGSFLKQKIVSEVNYRGTQRVAAACLKNDVPLVFPSTTSVYGSEDKVMSEDLPYSRLKPQSPYADTKRRSELHLHSLTKRGLRFTILRFGTIFGPSVGMRFHTAVNRFCWQAAHGQPLTVWKTALEQRRPYLDVRDAVGAISFFLKKKSYEGRVFNVVTDNFTVAEIVKTIRKNMGALKIKLVSSKIMNTLSYDVPSSKIKRLGFRFCGNLAKGVADTLNLLRIRHS